MTDPDTPKVFDMGAAIASPELLDEIEKRGDRGSTFLAPVPILVRTCRQLQADKEKAEAITMALISRGAIPSATRCAYCFEEICDNPTSDQVTEHTAKCEKHPMHALAVELDKFRTSNAELVAELIRIENLDDGRDFLSASDYFPLGEILDKHAPDRPDKASEPKL